MDYCGLRWIYAFVLLSPVYFSNIDGLVCRECFYATNARLCRFNSTCPPGELCGVHKITYNGQTEYHLGCTSKDICSGNANPSPIIGRRRRAPAASIWLHCCDSDMCNIDPEHLSSGPQSSIKPTPSSSIENSYTNVMHSRQVSTSGVTLSSTILPPAVNHVTEVPCEDRKSCSYLLQHFSLCNDPESAKTFCPKSCGRCGNICKDTDDDCPYLIKNFNICSNPEAIRQIGCEASCGVCGGNNLPSWSSGVSHFKQLQASQTIDSYSMYPMRSHFQASQTIDSYSMSIPVV